MKIDADVAVVGLGTMGSMAAWQLARDGADVLAFEQFGVGHDRAAAGGESRIFRTAYKEGPEYVPLLRRARQLWRELEVESSWRLLRGTGGLTIGTAGTVDMNNVLESAQRYDVPHEVLDADELAWRFPQHAVRPGETAVLDHTAGVLRPEYAVIAAVSRAVAHSARVHSGVAVSEVTPHGDHVVIVAGGREYTVRKAVVAGGPWSAQLLPEVAGQVRARRIVMTWFATSRPELYGPERFPIFIRERDGHHFFGIPSLDGGSVKVALTVDDESSDPDLLDRDVHPASLDLIRDLTAACLPGLHSYPHRVSVHMDGYTPDGHAIVGAVPGASNLWVLAGFSGHGFKMAPAIGRAVADLVARGTTELPLEHLAPGRTWGAPVRA